MSWGEATIAAEPRALDILDRLAVAFLALPLGIFLVGWFELWAALPLLVR